MEFKIGMAVNVCLTTLTFIWSVRLIHSAVAMRRQNQSSQVKAMWRVEGEHFNPQFEAIDRSAKKNA